jgi:hypothetical protein
LFVNSIQPDAPARLPLVRLGRLIIPHRAVADCLQARARCDPVDPDPDTRGRLDYLHLGPCSPDGLGHRAIGGFRVAEHQTAEQAEAAPVGRQQAPQRQLVPAPRRPKEIADLTIIAFVDKRHRPRDVKRRHRAKLIAAKAELPATTAD